MRYCIFSEAGKLLYVTVKDDLTEALCALMLMGKRKEHPYYVHMQPFSTVW